MSDESGIEPRPVESFSAINARVTALEARATADEARISALEALVPGSGALYTCPSGAAVRDLVYMTGTANTVGIADASNPAKMPAVAFIVSKPTATTCIIQRIGELGGFTGRTPGALQYADPATPGGITETRPDPLVNEAQEVGYAKSATVVVATIIGNPPIPV